MRYRLMPCYIISFYNLIYSVLHFPIPSSPLLSPPALLCLLLISHFLTSPTLNCLLLSRRFGDAYCEFPKRLRVIEEVRAMVKTIMATDDSAGTSLHHLLIHSLTDCVSHCLRLANWLTFSLSHSLTHSLTQPLSLN